MSDLVNKPDRESEAVTGMEILRCATVGHSWTGEDRQAVMELIAEVERHRAALTEIQRLGEFGMRGDYKEWLTFHDKVAQIARLSLGRTGS